MTSVANGRVGLIVNPLAGKVNRRYLQRAPFWRRHLAAAMVRIPADFTELDAAIVAFRAARVDVVAVLGGDGTLHHVVDALLRHYSAAAAPIVLALGGGTMNGVAQALGIRGRPERILESALTRLMAGRSAIREQPLLRISNARNGNASHGFSFATGLVYRAFHGYYRSRGPRLLAAIRASLLPITGVLGGRFYDTVRIDVDAGGEAWLAESHTLLASVLANPLLWFTPFGATVPDHTTFGLAATSLRPFEIVPRLWSIFRGRCRHPRLRVGPAEEAAVRAVGIGYLIDGDLYEADGGFDVRLAVGPPLRFLAALG
jgi:hypothetical protein